MWPPMQYTPLFIGAHKQWMAFAITTNSCSMRWQLEGHAITGCTVPPSEQLVNRTSTIPSLKQNSNNCSQGLQTWNWGRGVAGFDEIEANNIPWQHFFRSEHAILSP